jgi:hypothetical protein
MINNSKKFIIYINKNTIKSKYEMKFEKLKLLKL